MKISRRCLMGLAVVAGLGLAVNASAQAFEPVKPVDFIIMAGKGGGADKMARLMQTIVEKHKMASKPLIPINKPGGSGAEALVHVQNAKDQDHTIMVTLNSFYTTPMRQPGLGVDSLKFAPVARMADGSWAVPVNCRKTSSSRIS